MKTLKQFVQEAKEKNDNWGYTPRFGNKPEHQLKAFDWKEKSKGEFTHHEYPGHVITLHPSGSGEFTHSNLKKHVTYRPLSHDLTSHLRQFHLSN